MDEGLNHTGLAGLVEHAGHGGTKCACNASAVISDPRQSSALSVLTRSRNRDGDLTRGLDDDGQVDTKWRVDSHRFLTP